MKKIASFNIYFFIYHSYRSLRSYAHLYFRQSNKEKICFGGTIRENPLKYANSLANVLDTKSDFYLTIKN